MEILLNQTQYAELHGIKQQRVGQLIKQGELLTQKKGNRVYVIDCKFNSDVVRLNCMGTGHWNRPRNYY